MSEEAATIVKEAEASTENVTDLPTDQGAPVKFDSLFDNETVSEAELKGEEEPSQEKTPADSESLDAETKPKEEGTEAKPDDGMIKAPDLTGDEEKLDEDPIEGKPVEGEEKPDYSKPPPKGYVPTPAVQKERRINLELKGEIAALQAQIEENAQEVKPESADEFKVLSDDEFEDLLEEDPDAALLYERKLRQKEKTEQVETTAKASQARNQKAEAGAIMGFVDEIQTAVPGVYDQDSGVMDNLVQHAEESGFDPAFLNAMTNPASKIIIPGSKKVFSLGKGAVSLVKLLNTSLTAKKESNPESLRADLTKEITEKVTKELITKFKNDASGIRSIGDIPGDSGEIDDKAQYSERDFHQMSPEDEKKALGG